MKTVDEIVSYIVERALVVDNPDPVVQVYAASLEVKFAVGEVMRRLRSREKEGERKPLE